jgi:Tfp pilus assembly protein PilP
LQRSAYAELAWQPYQALEVAAEVRGQGRLPVNDVNSDFAGGFGLLALRARWQMPLPDPKLGQVDLLLRVDNLLYQVKVGDHLGQNYGLITKIAETEIVLRELVMDASGEMIERPATLQLQERAR